MDTSPREVPVTDAITFAEANRMDFVETSALKGENVEMAFRRLVLSVAVLLPPVRVHMSLTGLPDGWISIKVKDERADVSSVASVKAELEADTRAASQSSPSSSGRSRNMYCNYWTGEMCEAFPSSPAETGLLYLAIRTATNSDGSSLART